jgi:hypothetical protein
MPDQLSVIDADFRAVNERARALVHRIGVERLCERPPKGGWSIAECFEHLNLTTQAFMPQWRDLFASARAQGLTGDGPYKTELWGKLLTWMLEPPAKFRMPTTPPFNPLSTPPADRVLSTFLACQNEMVAIISEARGLALDRIKVRSPFDKKMQYSVWSSFRIGAAHHRRHLWQAERVADAISKV